MNGKTKDIAFTGIAAAIIAVCSFITIPVGAVPVTLQTFAVCLVSGILGLKRGTLSVLIYILIGALGVPVFSGFKGGIGVLLGATGGYIIGFVFTAMITGFVSDRTKKLPALMLSMALGAAICYAFGTAWFILVYTKEQMPLGKTLALCVTPFLIPDAVKITVASLLTFRLRDRLLKTQDG
ncbi:MAG: biotin transporter BioY [Eubacterium sp.]|nr:biotin transporter BioY [Eubacterium sp.]